MFKYFFIIITFFVNSHLLNQSNKTNDNNLCQHQEFSNICNGNFNISRINMPQLTTNTKKQFLAIKQSERIYTNPMNLQPIQSEISIAKVSKIIDTVTKHNCNICSNPNLAILVTKNNKTNTMYIVDGHHRYAACRLMNQSLYVDVIYGEIMDILDELNKFDGIFYKQ